MNAKDEVARLQAQLDSGELPPDEPLFTIRAQDLFAESVLNHWITLLAQSEPFLATKPGACRKMGGAIACCEQIAAWPVKQIPGCPETRTSVS